MKLSWVIVVVVFVQILWADVQFKKKDIEIGSQKLKVEIADTPERRTQGLMYRKTLKDGEGMLFIFETPEKLSFWMKNTLIPLSIGYIDKNGKLFQILDMQPASVLEMEPPTYDSVAPALYALEVPQGWFKKKNVKVGAKLKPLKF